jgi:uncharacterized repeat protein (TIGR01451 family)
MTAVIATAIASISLVGLDATTRMTPAGAVTPPSAVTDVNPNSVTSGQLRGGRVVDFSTDPLNPNNVLAASELGGLWRSTNHGASWSHVDQVPLTAMGDVEYSASDPSLVIATGGYDGSIDNRGGGIWRSTDGGATWAKAPGSNVCATMRQNNAHKAAIAPGTAGSLRIYVGLDCGLAISTNSGASWTLSNPSPGRFWDVQVQQVATPSPHLQVDACGGANVFARSNDGGTTWPTITTIPQGGFDPCAINVSPNNPNIVFMATRSPTANPGDGIGETFQFESDDGGANWTDLQVSIDGNGRDPNAYALPGFDGVANHIEVFFMTDQVTMRAQCDTNNAPACPIGNPNTNTANCGAQSTNGSWLQYDSGISHCAQDPGAFAIDRATNCPFLHGGDGGIWSTANGCVNTPAWTNADDGLHALWAYQSAATSVPGGSLANPAPHTSVWLAMQDNGLYCSNDDMTNVSECSGADGFNVLADRDGPPSSFLRNVNGGYSRSNENGTAASWTSPTGRLDSVTQFGDQSYAFITDDNPQPPPNPPPAPTYRVQVTTNAGGTWTQMGPNLPGPPTLGGSPPSSIVASGTAANPVFYLELNVGGPKIYRLSGPLNGTATLTQVNSGLINPTVFNVDPVDPLKLYAVDTGGATPAAKFTTNGGASWQVDNGLSNIVTQGGVYPFFQANVGSNISAFGFDANSDNVLVGTNFSGIYASPNNGGSWVRLNGSEQVSRVADFSFDTRNPNTAYVSSAGRGLWHIVLPEANLTVTKSDSPDPVIAGTELYYTITATNNGPSTATVQVVDTLPGEVRYVTNDLAPPDGCVEGPVGTVTCNLGVLASGASKSFRIKVAVKPDAIVNTGPKSIVNSVKVQSTDTFDSDTADNTAVQTTIVEDQADLAVTKLCKPDTTVLAGQPINCTVFVDNYGPSYARNVVVDDVILANGTFNVTNVVPALGVGTPGCTLTAVTGGQKLSCRLGNLENASTTTAGRATITYTITANEGMDINNVAKVRSDTPDPDATNNTATVNLTVTAVANLALTKTGPATATAGTDISYTLTVTNNGPSTAKNVIVTDAEPAAVTINSITPTIGTCNAGVPGDALQPTRCSFGTLGVGASASVTISVHIKPDTLGVIHDDARASSDTFDTDLSDNLATLATNVTASADLAITKGSSPNPVLAGQQLTYTLTATNNGPSTAVAVKITDTLPNGTSFVSGVDQNGTTVCALVQTGTVVCDLGTMQPGASKTVLITVLVAPSVPNGTILVNTATVSSSTPDPNLANNTVNNNTTVNTQAELWLDKTAVLRSGNPAPVVTYTLYVHNNAGCETDAQSGQTPNCGAGGPSDAQGITVTDTLPLDYKKVTVQFLSPQCTWTKATNTVVCQTPTIPAGATATFVIEAQVQGSVGTITNTATVTSTTADPVIANNTNAAAIVVKGGTGKTR